MNYEKKTAIYNELLAQAETMQIIDSHEHLSSEQERISAPVTFTDLFKHYTENDLYSLGLPKSDMDEMYSNETSLERKWEIFHPAYELIKNGNYARCARISMEKFYGYGDLTSLNDAIDVTEKMKANNTPGLYNRVLKDACHIEKCVNFSNDWNVHEIFEQVPFVDYLTEPVSMNLLQNISSQVGGVHAELDGYVQGLKLALQKLKDKGAVGVKIVMAYNRDLRFELYDRSEAERLYRRLAIESLGWRPSVLGYQEMRPLQNYLVHKLCEFSGEVGLPVVFHTGIQAGNCNHLDNSRPEFLYELFLRYPKTQYILLHAGLPWINETILLTKYYPNVFFDLAWVHMISNEIAKTTIKNYVEMAPRNKIFGYGGDYNCVELVYGHLDLARKNIACALADKVLDGQMTTDEAFKWQEAMLYSNPKKGYGLK